MPGDRVTLRDIYTAINELDGKWDKRMTKSEDRIDKLETFRDKTLGFAAVISAFTGTVASYIWQNLTKKG